MTKTERQQFTSKAWDYADVEEKSYGYIVSMTKEDFNEIVEEVHFHKENELFMKSFLKRFR